MKFQFIATVFSVLIASLVAVPAPQNVQCNADTLACDSMYGFYMTQPGGHLCGTCKSCDDGPVEEEYSIITCTPYWNGVPAPDILTGGFSSGGRK